MPGKRFPALLAATLAAALFAPAAAAQPAPPANDAATAEYKLHMENGVKLYQDKNYEAAIAEFFAAYKAKPKANPLLNISLCRKAEFQYPKAIEALETALSKHGDTMDAADKKAAQDAIVEMRGLLAYVKVDVTPSIATVTVDGEDVPPGAAAKPIALGPGTHRIAAHTEGFGSAEQTVTVASGERDRSVVLKLSANKGWVRVRAGDPKVAIAIDQKPRAYGEWTGFLDPGDHIVQFYRLGGQSYSMQVPVEVGKVVEVRPGVGGVPVTVAPPAVLPPVSENPNVPPPAPQKPVPAVHGVFGLVTGSLLGPIRRPEQFPSAGFTTGAAGGIRAGYRVNTPASFDVMFEYGSVTVSASGDEATRYTLSSARFGANLRLMSSGKTVRFVGDLGGGFVHDDFKFETGKLCKVGNCGDLPVCDPNQPNHTSCSGFNAFILGEIGLEVDISGVLIGAAVQNYFQSIRGIDNKPFGTDALFMFGGGLRVGYAAW